MRTIPYAALLALIVAAPSVAQASDWIRTDTTQNGGTYVVNPSGAGTLIISDLTNDPLFTLKNGAQTSEINLVSVGLYSGESGRLLVEEGSTLSNTANSSGVLFTGDGILGLESGSTGKVTVTGSGSQWLNDGNLTIGDFGTGELTVEDAGVVTSLRGYLGNNAGSTGIVTVTGSGSKWINSFLFVGQDAGTSTLTVENGGIVVAGSSVIGNNGGTGTVTVTGIGSQWQGGRIEVGAGGTGTLIIEDGGFVIGDGNIGSSLTSSSSVTVTGAGSTWQSGALIVGDYGTGTLTIENGGLVTSSSGTIGSSYGLGASTGVVIITGAGSQWQCDNGPLSVSGDGLPCKIIIENGGLVTSSGGYVGAFDGSGTATVTGSGSRWMNSGDLSVGYATGTGTLTIQNGGFVTSSSTYLGVNHNSIGTATVTGAGSQWHNKYLTVGELSSGTGKLNVENGGLVITSHDAHLGYTKGSAGFAIVTGSGSQWQVNGDLVAGNGGIGKLTIENGGVVEVGEVLTLGIYGTLSGNGGTIVGDVVSSGLISPGSSPGILTIDGDLTSTGIVKFELAGTGSGLFDQLLVGGNLKLGGVVEIDLLDGFDPAAGNSFNLLDFGSFKDLGYQFDFAHAVLKNGFSWDTSMFAVDGTIRVVPEAGSLILAGVGVSAGLVCWRTKSRSQ